MNKLAIFVEGQTESIFAERLLREIAGGGMQIEQREARGGGRSGKIRAFDLEPRSGDTGPKHYVLIYDCGGDSKVKSDVLEQYDSLVRNGYQAIIGIRDVYPNFSYDEIPQLRSGLAYGMKTKPVEVVMALGIMEIETWFISEYTHFERMNPILTLERIHAEVGFNPRDDDVELRPHPAGDLKAIYALACLSYNKKKAVVERTVDTLDYARLYLKLGEKHPDLQHVSDCIDGFLSS
jgi:hypothetical protein